MNVKICEKDGHQILDIIKSDKIDVVISSMFMVNLDLVGVLKAIKEMDKNVQPQVIAISVFNSDIFEKQALEAGAAYYFLKPLDFNELALVKIKRF